MKLSAYVQCVTRAVHHSEVVVALQGQNREKELAEYAYRSWWRAVRNLQDTQLKFNLIWKLSYTHGIRAVLQMVIGYQLIRGRRTRMKSYTDGEVLAFFRYTYELTMEMLIGDPLV